MYHQTLSNFRWPYICIPLSKSTLAVIGWKQNSVFDLNTKLKIKNIPFLNSAHNILVFNNYSSVFITSDQGLFIFSLPDFEIIAIHSSSFCTKNILYLEKLKMILVSSETDFFHFDSNDKIFVKVFASNSNSINSIATTDNNDFIFAIFDHKMIVKINVINWQIAENIEMAFSSNSLLVCEKYRSLLIGTEKGIVFELSLSNLKIKRSHKVHNWTIQSFLRLTDDLIVSCSDDGTIAFPFTNFKPIRVSSKNVKSVAMIDKEMFVCSSFGAGIKMVKIPSEILSLIKENEIQHKVDFAIKSLSVSNGIQALSYFIKIGLPKQLKSNLKNDKNKNHKLLLTLSNDFSRILRGHLSDNQFFSKVKSINCHFSLEFLHEDIYREKSIAIIVFFKEKKKICLPLRELNLPKVYYCL